MRAIDAGANCIVANADYDALDSLLCLPGIRYKILRDNFEGNWRNVGVTRQEISTLFKEWVSRSENHKLLYVVGDRPHFLGSTAEESRIQLAKAIAHWDEPTLDNVIEDAKQTTMGVPPDKLFIEVGNSSDESGTETPFPWNPLAVSTTIPPGTIRKREQAWKNKVEKAFRKLSSGIINVRPLTWNRSSHLYLYADRDPFVIRTWSGKLGNIITELGVVGYPALSQPSLWITLLSTALRAGATVIILHEPFLSDFGKQRAVLDGHFPKRKMTDLELAKQTLAFEKRQWPDDYGAFCFPEVQQTWKAFFER